MSIISARLPQRSARNKAELSRHAASPLYDILRFEIVSLSLKPGYSRTPHPGSAPSGENR